MLRLLFSTVAVIGPKADPEIRQAERLLRTARVACVDARRANRHHEPGMIWVGLDPAPGQDLAFGRAMPGHPADAKPEYYYEGPLFRTIRWMAEQGILPPWRIVEMPDYADPASVSDSGSLVEGEHGWVVREGRLWKQIPMHLHATAAARFGAAAYRGECPGISPEAFGRWRATVLFPQLAPDVAWARLRDVKEAVAAAPRTIFGDVQVANLDLTTAPRAVLAEASTWVGMPVLYVTQDDQHYWSELVGTNAPLEAFVAQARAEGLLVNGDVRKRPRVLSGVVPPAPVEAVPEEAAESKQAEQQLAQAVSDVASPGEAQPEPVVDLVPPAQTHTFEERHEAWKALQPKDDPDQLTPWEIERDAVDAVIVAVSKGGDEPDGFEVRVEHLLAGSREGVWQERVYRMRMERAVALKDARSAASWRGKLGALYRKHPELKA